MKSINLLNTNPLVSVVIPVYNGEKYITECLESVYQQTYPSFEVIIIDDGSTDQSLEIINKMPGDKKIISQQNKDVSHARNTGIKNASGQLIAFLDQDDLWDTKRLEKLIRVFMKNPDVDLFFTDLSKFNDEGKNWHPRDRHKAASRLRDENLFENLIRKNVLMPSAVMVKKDRFIEAGMFDPQFKTCGDYEMWLRMAAKGMRFKYLPEPLTLYRQHGENTSKKIEIMNEDRLNAIRKTFSLNGLSPSQKKLEKLGFASVYREGAQSYFGIKEYFQFLRYVNKALSYDKRIISWKIIGRYTRQSFPNIGLTL
jgi:glycosyltransferase involved in cell wall biosynthesis